MPRQLPWKVGAAATKQTPSRPKAAASPAPSAGRSPAPSHRPTPRPKAESTPEPSRRARRSLALSSGIYSPTADHVTTLTSEPARSPSTSPPPEPPKEEFMIEGVDHDDKYRMVEDEFLAVAGEFTRHLHAAEYQRLRGLAKSQNAETIQNISRPVTGEMTDLVKRRHAALDAASKQRKGIASTLGKRAKNEEEGSTRRALTSLQGLMDSPRKQAAPLSLTTGSRPGTSSRDAMDASPSRRRHEVKGLLRTSSSLVSDGKYGGQAVRFKREPTPDSDDGDDDLDNQPSWRPKSGVRHPDQATETSAPRSAVATPPIRSKSEPSAPNNPLRAAGAAPRQALAHGAPRSEATDAPNDGDDDFFSRLRARRTEQKRRRETKAQERNIKSETQTPLDEIPLI
ncbi:uncharacterized protein B0T15DRAFT_492062 [Chaetomium strumarium]|uniref:Uncharacterized protein n=1 Tax=Chaetomium strumarium TaxID=1170767 RepID=A0AAJ0GUQ6_9PEZI|nr:hypothetical protein B0T15DRAFT_492062 [Chaetomium strumarium]